MPASANFEVSAAPTIEATAAASHRRPLGGVRRAGTDPDAPDLGVIERLRDARIDDDELGAGRGEHADGRAARGEVRDHLPGHLLWVRALTPSAAMPWSVAATTIAARNGRGRSELRIAAICAARSSSRPGGSWLRLSIEPRRRPPFTVGRFQVEEPREPCSTTDHAGDEIVAGHERQRPTRDDEGCLGGGLDPGAVDHAEQVAIRAAERAHGDDPETHLVGHPDHESRPGGGRDQVLRAALATISSCVSPRSRTLASQRERQSTIATCSAGSAATAASSASGSSVAQPGGRAWRWASIRSVISSSRASPVATYVTGAPVAVASWTASRTCRSGHRREA